MSKKSQSEVITTVLIILLVIAAVFIVWVAVNSMIKGKVENIGTDKLDVSLSTSLPNIPANPSVIKVPVKREIGEGDLVAIKIVFKNAAGESKTVEKTDCIPPELETRICEVLVADLGGFVPVSWTVYPVIQISSGPVTGLPAAESSSVPQSSYPEYCGPRCSEYSTGDLGGGGWTSGCSAKCSGNAASFCASLALSRTGEHLHDDYVCSDVGTVAKICQVVNGECVVKTNCNALSSSDCVSVSTQLPTACTATVIRTSGGGCEQQSQAACESAFGGGHCVWRIA